MIKLLLSLVSEYNYQINANIFIKEVYQHIFKNQFKNINELENTYNKNSITKYMLLLLFLLNKKEGNINEPVLLELMSRHKGTGKYQDPNINWIGIGTPVSRMQIIENLYNLKFFKKIKIKNRNIIELSEEGKLFIQKLNKKLFDPDLPFRIHYWATTNNSIKLNHNNEEVFNKIDTYILSAFKAQKRKNKYL